MPLVMLDDIDKIEIESRKNGNAIKMLQTLFVGLSGLASSVKSKEVKWVLPPDSQFFSMGGDYGDNQPLIAVMFHWFSVSILNYARLVGYLRGLSRGDHSFDDLNDHTKFKTIKDSVDDYVRSIDELKAAKAWRNKVGAHFAIASPDKKDNIATLELSAMFSLTLENGRYFVGGMQFTRKNSAGIFTSELPHWSLTEVFESLIPRYWPNLAFNMPQPSPQPPAIELPPELTRLPDRQYDG